MQRISLWLQGSLFVLSTAAILFSEGLEGPAWQDWELRHRVLPRLVLSRAYDGRPKAKRALSPQKLFDLFPLQAKSANSVLFVVEQKLPEDRKVYSCLSPCDECKTLEG